MTAEKRKNGMPEPGDLAPDFEGMTQMGESVRLSDYRGKKVALYFYPKDDTPGCTKQACNLRDEYEHLGSEDIAVIGVSGDDMKSHKEFADKYDLPFPLVADTDRTILEKYGVWGEKSLYGRRFLGINRTTFLIDEDGVIRHVIKRPKVKEHAKEITAKFGSKI
jgi:peroxiredoxin Q/BCP